MFVQRCYEACAKDLYEDPYIITENNTETARNDNLQGRFNKHICQVIEDLVPTAEILQTYLPLPAAGEDLNLDHEDEEAMDEDPDMMNEDPLPNNQDGDPVNQDNSNMEFGKTPGGVDNTVTVNNTLTPPGVEGGTPAPEPENIQKMEQNLFDDAAESKTPGHQRIEKLG